MTINLIFSLSMMDTLVSLFLVTMTTTFFNVFHGTFVRWGWRTSLHYALNNIVMWFFWVFGVSLTMIATKLLISTPHCIVEFIKLAHKITHPWTITNIVLETLDVNLHTLEDDHMISWLGKQKFVELCTHGTSSWQKGGSFLPFTAISFSFLVFFISIYISHQGLFMAVHGLKLLNMLEVLVITISYVPWCPFMSFASLDI